MQILQSESRRWRVFGRFPLGTVPTCLVRSSGPKGTKTRSRLALVGVPRTWEVPGDGERGASRELPLLAHPRRSEGPSQGPLRPGGGMLLRTASPRRDGRTDGELVGRRLAGPGAGVGEAVRAACRFPPPGEHPARALGQDVF